MAEYNSYFPSYNGTYNQSDDLVAPWWIPGWTAQDKIAIDANSSSPLNPLFPTNLAFANVTGNFFDPNSSGIPGFITVMMSDSITVEDDGKYYRLPQRLTGWTTYRFAFAYNNYGNGALYLFRGNLSIELFCTDQTASSSTITTDSGDPFTYWITEHWLGGRQYQITLPSSDANTSVDINSLIVAGSVQPYAYDPVDPMGNMPIPYQLS